MKIKINMGITDRIIRAIVGIAIVVLYFTIVISGFLGILLLILAGILIITSAIGFCPLYQILMINTCKKEEHKDTNANL